MKKVYVLLTAVIFALTSAAQTHSLYVSPSIGPYVNTSVKDPLSMIGYAIEGGYSYKGMVNAGVSFGSLNLATHEAQGAHYQYAPFIQARTGFTFLERPAFSLTAAAGLGYCFGSYKDLMAEGDMVANVHLPKSFDLTLAFASQYVVGGGYLPAFNVGFCRSFEIKSKKK